MTPTVDVDGLLERLRAARDPEAVGLADALAFDGDGTLWSGDVAEDVFIAATARGLLREDARAPLRDFARAQGVSVEGDASALAQRLFQEYLEGRFSEREVCEVMAWCFAGFDRGEVSALAADIFRELDLDGRLNRALEPVFAWARSAGVRIILVSASPRPIVEVAAARWHIAPTDIAASTPAMQGERILPHIAEAIPYGPTKALHARARLDRPEWLGAFGDSGFDFELLSGARVPVAVRPKPSLTPRLPELGPSAVVFV